MNARQQYIAFSALLVKEIRRFMRIWVQTVLPAAITMALYFIIFGNLIGSQLNDIHGLRYIDYIVPGIILMSVINNSYANVVSSFYSAKFQRHVEELLISPMPNYLIIIGFIAGALGRFIMRSEDKHFISDIILGLLGAVVGGFVVSVFGINTDSETGLTSWLVTLAVATVGAMILIWLSRLIRGNRKKKRRRKR